jgi:hypothetical protein
MARQATGTDSLKGGDLFIDTIRTPSGAVEPGGSADIEVVITNGALPQELNTLLDDDVCNPGFASPGFSYRVTVDPEWTGQQVDEGCVSSAQIGTNSETLSFSFAAPPVQQTSTRRVTITLEARASGQRTSTTRTVTFDPDTGRVAPPPTDGDGGSGGGGGGGGTGPLLPCFLDPTRDCSPGELAGIGGVIAVILALAVR